MTSEGLRIVSAAAAEAVARGRAGDPPIEVTCPAGTTFDAAEALRLALMARAPAGVEVDVQIAPSAPGALSAEDAAGVQLFAAVRAERLEAAQHRAFVSVEGGPERSIVLREGEAVDVGKGCRVVLMPRYLDVVQVGAAEPALNDPYPWEALEGDEGVFVGVDPAVGPSASCLAVGRLLVEGLRDGLAIEVEGEDVTERRALPEGGAR